MKVKTVYTSRGSYMVYSTLLFHYFIVVLSFFQIAFQEQENKDIDT